MIFTLACTDGGRTGCALSLVSRQIRGTSSLVRFHTISLHGIPRMRSFLDTVKKQVSCPIITHLFLYDGGLEGRPYFGEDALSVITSIVSIFSPFLETFSGSLVWTGVTYNSLFPSGIDLSLLQELSVNVSPALDLDVALPNLPKLRRLHKWGRIRGWEDMLDVNAVIKVAPKIAQIRLSDLNLAQMVPAILDAALSQDPTRDEEGFKLRFPDNLEQLFVQCASIDDEGWCGTNRERHSDIKAALSKLAEDYEKVIVVPECNYTIEDCMEDWLEMIEGKGGWGRIPPRRTTSTLRYGRGPELLPNGRNRSRSRGPSPTLSM